MMIEERYFLVRLVFSRSKLQPYEFSSVPFVAMTVRLVM